MKITLNQIDYLEHDVNIDVPTVLMFHGYGASSEDLYSLYECHPGMNWVFPNGPLEVPIGPHITGRAWFPIDIEKLEQAMAKGEHRDLRNQNPASLEKITLKILKFIEDKKLSPSKLILGGFSQGGMLALEVASQLSLPVKGIIALSTNPIHFDFWAKNSKNFKDVPVFQSHGTHDPLLGYTYALELKKFLESSGARLEFHDFRGGHEIPHKIITSLTDFLNRLK